MSEGQTTEFASHVCDTGNFDRTLCPEPCGYMHSYCDACGKRQDSCAHDYAPAKGCVCHACGRYVESGGWRKPGTLDDYCPDCRPAALAEDAATPELDDEPEVDWSDPETWPQVAIRVLNEATEKAHETGRQTGVADYVQAGKDAAADRADEALHCDRCSTPLDMDAPEWCATPANHQKPAPTSGHDDRKVNDVARLLIAAWEAAEDNPVGASYVATFVDMARAVLAAGFRRHPEGTTVAEALAGPAPEDDDREALAQVVLDATRQGWIGSYTHHVADAVLAAGFRRHAQGTTVTQALADRTWADRPHRDPYCATHCQLGTKHSQCGCDCNHRKDNES